MKKRIYHGLCAVLLGLALTGCASGTQNTQLNSASSNNTETSSNEVAVSMSELPNIPPSKLFQHVLPQKFTLKNGIPVWYVHNAILPMVTVKFVFPGGSCEDPANKEGRAALMASLLKEGANGKSATELSDAIEEIGASISTFASTDYISVSLQVLTQFFETGLDLTMDIIRKPNLESADLERLKKIWLNSLNMRAASPEQLAKLASLIDFFGEGHPYARPTEGYIGTVNAISLDDIRENYQNVVVPGKVMISAVGNIEPAQFIEMLNQRLGDAPAQPAYVQPAPIVHETRQQTFTIIDKPGAPQSIIRIMLPAPALNDPLSQDLKFVNIPFGDSFTSRLMQNIREDKGYSYGANSAVASLPRDGYILASSAVATNVTGAALSEFMKEFKRLETGDFTQEELERARATWQSEIIQNFENQAGVASLFLNLLVSGRPDDFQNAFLKRTRDMDLDTFNSISRQFSPFSTASITIVGDKSEILKQTKDLGLVAPTFRDKEGKIIP